MWTGNVPGRMEGLIAAYAAGPDGGSTMTDSHHTTRPHRSNQGPFFFYYRNERRSPRQTDPSYILTSQSAWTSLLRQTSKVLPLGRSLILGPDHGYPRVSTI